MLSSAMLNVLMFVATEEETLKTRLEKSKVDVAVACVNGLDTKTLAASTKESLNNLSPEVFSRLSAATQEALGKAPGATEGKPGGDNGNRPQMAAGWIPHHHCQAFS